MTDGLYIPMIVDAPQHQFEGSDISSMAELPTSLNLQEGSTDSYKGKSMAGRVIVSNSPASSIKCEALEALNLTTLAQWLEREPITTHAAMLEGIANDLSRRRDYPTLAGEIKDAARNLRAMTRHGEGG